MPAFFSPVSDAMPMYSVVHAATPADGTKPKILIGDCYRFT